MAKCTKAEKEKRINAIYSLILRGASRHEILQFARSMGWDVRPRTVDTYITKAYQQIQEEGDRYKSKEYAKAKTRLNDLYRKCYGSEKYAQCLNIQKEMNNLCNLYEVSDSEGSKGIIQQWLETQKNQL